jgi:hypothetical protein
MINMYHRPDDRATLCSAGGTVLVAWAHVVYAYISLPPAAPRDIGASSYMIMYIVTSTAGRAEGAPLFDALEKFGDAVISDN